LIEAAERAGVRRFVSSDFGAFPEGSLMYQAMRPSWQRRARQQSSVLREKAKQNPPFTWSTFVNGPLFGQDFGFDVKSQSAIIFDSGNEPLTAMAIKNIGQAVASMLEFLEQTANRPLQISALLTTQNKNTKGRTQTKWNKVDISTKDAELKAGAMLRNGDYKGAYIGLLVAQLFEDGAGRGVGTGADNKLLGVAPERLEDIIEVTVTEA
ncbi:uncharacterized protein BO95DRAFT_376794, partial [Aspergillus brunneoviolaceus CBS 621.78]